jgi:hypothetical protein
MLPSANQDLTELRHERSHKLLMLRSISIFDVRWETGGKRVEALQLLLDIPKLRRAPPHCMPVNVLDFLVVGGLDDVEHVLGGVCISGARRSAVSFEILKQCLRLIAEV